MNEHYNVFVYAFGAINLDNTVIIPSGISDADLQDQVSIMHENGALALLSLGGQNNTFIPDPNNMIQAADNTAALLLKDHFDGLDLDLESIDSKIIDNKGSLLIQYINEIRKKDPNVYITAAPQIGGGYDGRPAFLAPATIYSADFIKDAHLTAFFIQEYNQFGGAVFNGKQDTDEGFITASFTPLTKIIPETTKIVIGEPANSKAGSGLSNPSDIVKDITDGNVVLKSPQFGGIMTWDANYDSAQQWSFATGVSSLIIQQHKK